MSGNPLRLALHLAAVAALVGGAIGCSDSRAKDQPAAPPPAPITITRITPVSGPTAGATAVTIIGVKFIDGGSVVDDVTFGGVSGTNLIILSANQLTVDTPAGTGAVDVVVSNSITTESATAVKGFTFFNGATPPAPTLAGISPTSGPVGGGSTVTITGSGFVPGTTVTIGGAAATAVNVLTGGILTAVIPAGTAPGAVTVAVNNGGGTASIVGGFVYTGASGNPAPTVSSPLTPSSGSIVGGTLVTITGANFVSTPTSKPTVRFATGTATGVTVIHAGLLTCLTPSGPSGAVTVTVTNPDGQSGSLASGYTYITPSPTITGISPTSGAETIAHSVTITGTNFFSGVTVTFGGVAGTVTSALLNQLIVTTPTTAGSGTVTVVVTNTAGTPSTASTSYTFNPPPTFTSINPTSGSTAGGTPFTIVGTNFLANPSVQFGGRFAAISSSTGTQIVGTAPSSFTTGAVNVLIGNTDGQTVTATNAFTYVPSPSITSITPNVGPTAGGITVTINGGNFQSGATVLIGSSSAPVTFNSPTQLRVTLPSSGSTGPVNVTVTNPTPSPPNNIVTATNGFTYSNNPVVTSVSTAAAPAACDTAGNNPGTTTACTITIAGNTFLTGATVAIDQSGTPVLCTGVSVNGPGTQITCLAPTSGLTLTGAADVVVTNPGGLADTTPHQTINVVYDTNFQTRQYQWDTSAGIDCRRKWYIDCNNNAFLKDLQNRGLQTWGTPGDTSAPPGTLTLTDQYARDWMRAYVLSTINVAYGRNPDGSKNSGSSINVTFCGLPPASGSPGTCASPSTDYSRHAVGGCNPSEGGTTHPKASQTGTGCNGATVGVASYDSGTPCGNSAENNYNTCYHGPSGCTGSRGTFSAGIGNIWGASLAGGRLTTGDQQYLDGTTTSGTRYNQIHNHMIQYAHRIAFVTSHECGHSLGLVANTTSTGACSSGSGQCSSTGSHNNCCTKNIMRSIVTLSGTLTATSFTFSTGGTCASPSSLNSWAMLTSFLGLSP